MQKKINKILLVDDSDMDNFYHNLVIKKSEVTDEIVVATNAFKALDILRDRNINSPDLIFLDINMPAMDGWGFLDEYKQISTEKKPVIVMLSTSHNPDDIQRAESIEEINEYQTKPLTNEKLIEIIERYF